MESLSLIGSGATYYTYYYSNPHNLASIIVARNVFISTSGQKSDVTIVFADPDFLYDAGILAIRS